MSWRLIIRTPREVVLDEPIRGARMPAASGQFGLRPGAEPFASVVEPGMIVLRTATGTRFAASAGGLLASGRDASVLCTPFAVVGSEGGEVLSALERALATPDSELAARRRLGELEQRIAHSLRQSSAGAHAGRRHG